MPQKIKIHKLEKPQEYIKKELDILSGQRRKLLVSSDWTQNVDAGLAVSNVLEWRYWRHKVRSILINENRPVDIIKSELEKLEKAKPKCKKRGNEYYRHILTDFNYSNIEKFKISCIMILTEIKPAFELTETVFAGKRRKDDIFAELLRMI